MFPIILTLVLPTELAAEGRERVVVDTTNL